MNHHQMTIRILLLLICLVLLGGLIYYFLVSGMVQFPLMSNNLLAVPVAQSPATSTSLIGTTTGSSHSPTSVLPTVPHTPSKSTTPLPPMQGSGTAAGATITNTDNNSSVALTTGERFAVNLGGGLNWNLTFSPSSSVQLVSASSTNAGQGTYKATVPGAITLKASGAPICSAYEACPMFLAVFSTTLNVR